MGNLNAAFTCGNHERDVAPFVPQYSGSLVSIGAGDEIAMNSMVLSVVSIDGGGNGEGLIKVPMMGNIKLGVKLSGIQVAEGGCIVGGRAELSGVAISLLTDKQKAELTKAYDTVTAITQTAIANAGAIAETYNGLSAVLNAVKDKANAITNKIANGGTPTKTELAGLQQAVNQGAAQMQTSLDAMRAGLGDKINAELANNVQAQIDKIKTDAVAIGNSATAQAATLALAKTEPAAVEKNIKKLLPLAVGYNSKNYSTNGTIIKMQPGELGGLIQNSGDIHLNCGFYLKNMVEGEPISWKLQTSSGSEIALEAPLRISASATDAYLGIKWPDGQTSLKLTVVSGDRSLNFTLQKPEWSVNGLQVAEGARIAKAGEKENTLYLVKAPLKDEKATVSWSSNIDPLLLKNHYFVNGSETPNNITSNKIPYIFSESPNKTTYRLNALGYDESVKVEVVDYKNSKTDFTQSIKGFWNILKGIEKISDAASTVLPCKLTFMDMDNKIQNKDFSGLTP